MGKHRASSRGRFFVEKAQLSVESRSKVCQYLQVTYVLVQEGVVCDSVIVTTSHDIVGSAVVAIFLYNIEARDGASTPRDICYTFLGF